MMLRQHLGFLPPCNHHARPCGRWSRGTTSTPATHGRRSICSRELGMGSGAKAPPRLQSMWTAAQEVPPLLHPRGHTWWPHGCETRRLLGSTAHTVVTASPFPYYVATSLLSSLPTSPLPPPKHPYRVASTALTPPPPSPTQPNFHMCLQFNYLKIL